MTLKAISIGVNSYQNLVETDRALVDSLAGQLPGVLLSPGVAMSAITDLQVTAGTGHTVNVGAGKAVVREKTTPLVRGAYFFQADAIEASVALPVPDTQPFYAAVVARVTDPQYGTVTGNVGARIDVIKGTPAASPVVVPDATIDAVTNTPGGWIRLADVRINTGDTGAIPGGQITDTRKPSGWGLIKCLSTNRPTGVSGLQIYEYDTKAYGFYDGTTWVMWDTQWQTYTPVWSASGTQPGIGNGSIAGKYLRKGREVSVHIVVIAGSTTTFGSGQYFFSVPPGMTIATVHASIPTLGTAWAINQGSWYLTGTINVQSSTTVSIFLPTSPTNVAQGQWTSTAPWTFKNTDQATLSFAFPLA